jgi:hypothetical protein
LNNEIQRAFAQGATKYQTIDKKATPETPEFTFPTASPLQKSSYVSADGETIVQIGDVIERLDSKGNVVRGVVGARANIYVSQKVYEYSDYVRVKLDNGKYDWMPTSKLTVLVGGSPDKGPGTPEPTAPEAPSSPAAPTPDAPSTPEAPSGPPPLDPLDDFDPFADDAPLPEGISQKPKQKAPAGKPEVGQTYTSSDGKTYKVMGYDRENGNIIITIDSGDWEQQIVSLNDDAWNGIQEVLSLEDAGVKEAYFPSPGIFSNMSSYEDESGNVWSAVVKGKTAKTNKDVFILTGVDSNGNAIDAPMFLSQDDIEEFVKIEAFKPVGAADVDGQGVIAAGINSKGAEFLDKVGAPSYTDYKEGIQGTLVKSKDGKYIVPGFLVKNDDGDTGIVLKTNPANDRTEVLWLDGVKKGVSDSDVYSGSLTRLDSWVDAESAESMGVSGMDTTPFDTMKQKNAEKLKLESEAKKIAIEQERIKAEIDAKKANDSVKASGFEPETVSGPADWSSSPVENISSLSEALSVATSDNDAEAARGALSLMDSDAIEDLEVRVHKILDENGQPAIRVQLSLTDWAGNSLAKRLKKVGDGIREGVYLNSFNKEGGLLRKKSSDKEIDSKGATYSGEAGRGRFTFYRSNKTGASPNYFIRPGGAGSGGPVAFHNKMEIILPEDASSEDIADALKALQVTKHVRPPTESDIRGVIENKLIRMFASKTDGRINYTGETRQIALQSIKDTWGVTADDIEISPTSSRGFAFLLPESVGKQIADMTGVTHVSHRWTGGGSGYPSSGTSDERAQWLFDFITGGSLLSTADRWTEGIYVDGMSSKTDTKGPGGEFVYTNKHTGPINASSGTLTFYFDGARVLRRLDHYSNKFDAFGQLSEDKNYIDALNGQVHEILFKNSISWADLSGIALSSEIRKILIDKLTEVDWDFGGRTPDEVLGQQINEIMG